MKLLNENRIIWVLIFLGCVFSSFQDGPRPVEGIWIYKKITKNGTPIASLTDNDTMLLNYNKFKYDIESLGKHEHGDFKRIQEKSLSFEYQNSENQVTHTRVFNIVKLTGDSLVIEEGPLKFYYIRKK